VILAVMTGPPIPDARVSERYPVTIGPAVG
jgi:hypothetical protein